jgi:hydrogenase nickel incorporation protein HypA/HybF
MHEMSLCEGILEVLESEAEKQQFSQVKKVWLEIGELSCVEPDAMRFCYDMVVKDSIAAGSELIIIPISGLGRCDQCAHTMPVQSRFDPCTECGAYQLTIVTGDEMKIKELEVN